jgi:glycerol uptake facilitator-like aquaporin
MKRGDFDDDWDYFWIIVGLTVAGAVIIIIMAQVFL